jgi:hypothetical protein
MTHAGDLRGKLPKIDPKKMLVRFQHFMGQEQSCGKVTKVKRFQSEFMMGVVRTSNGLCEE